jgi:integrase
MTAQGYVTKTLALADDNGPADGHAVLTFAQAQDKARAFFIELRRAGDGVAPVRRGVYTVADVMSDYMTKLKSEGRLTSSTESVIQGHIVGPIGAKDATKLTAPLLAGWFNDVVHGRTAEFTKRKLAHQARPGETEGEFLRRRRSTAKRIAKPLRAALGDAFRAGKIPSDHAWKAWQMPKKTETARVTYFETVEEVLALLEAFDDEGLRNFSRGALECGARFGEMATARVRDFNARTGVIRLVGHKTGGDERYVHLGAGGAAFFRAVIADRKGDELLFSNNGEEWVHHLARPAFQRALKVAGIDKRAGYHTLRHTFASLRLMAGASLQTVSKQLGHKSIAITDKHYAHLCDRYVEQQMQKSAPDFGAPLREVA